MRLAFIASAAALALFGLAFPAQAAPEDHGTVGSSIGQVLIQDFQKGARSAHPVHLHTLNARNREFGRTAAGPDPGAVNRTLTCRSTAYCLRGFTARGTAVQYGTVAVDPRVIPLGSVLYVEGYGWARALDTGGAVRGNTIDLWFPTLGQCYQWGCRSVTVKIVSRPR